MINKSLALWAGSIILGLVQPAFADQNHYGMPSEWFTCKASENCGKVNIGCNVIIGAANKEHVDQVRETVCNREPLKCPWFCESMPPDHFTAACVNGWCTMDQTAVKSAPFGVDPKLLPRPVNPNTSN